MKNDPTFYSSSGVRAEQLILLDQALWEETGLVGKVARGLNEGYTLAQVAQALGKREKELEYFERIVRIIRGDVSPRSVGIKTKQRVLIIVERMQANSTSVELSKMLATIVSDLEKYGSGRSDKNANRRSLFDSPQEDSKEVAEVAEVSIPAQVSKIDGKSAVYVYSYPRYLETISSMDDKTLYKIGASERAISRIPRQRRQTEVPEDLILLRVFYHDDPFALEVKFHDILKAANLHHKTTQGGVEWFNCSISTIDTIAKALGVDGENE